MKKINDFLFWMGVYMVVFAVIERVYQKGVEDGQFLEAENNLRISAKHARSEPPESKDTISTSDRKQTERDSINSEHGFEPL